MLSDDRGRKDYFSFGNDNADIYYMMDTQV